MSYKPPIPKLPNETAEQKLARLEIVRQSLGSWIRIIRMLNAGAIDIQLIDRRLTYCMKAIRMIRETGNPVTNLPGILEIRAEVIDEINSGEYFDTKQREREQFNASWNWKSRRPKL